MPYHRRRYPEPTPIDWQLPIDVDADGQVRKASPDEVIKLLQGQLDGHQQLKAVVARFDSTDIAIAIGRIVTDQLWANHSDRRFVSFESFEAFVTYLRPYGLETTVDVLLRHCRKHRAAYLLVAGALEPSEPQGGYHPPSADQVDSINSKNSGGTSPASRLKRLKRDGPDLFKEFLAEKITLAKAEVEAGIKPAVVTPLERMKKDWERLLLPERDLFLAFVKERPFPRKIFMDDMDWTGETQQSLPLQHPNLGPQPRPLTPRPPTPPASPTA